MRGTQMVFVAALTLISACASANRLHEYRFRDQTMVVEPTFPPYPEVLTGSYFPRHPDDPIHAIIRAGTRLAKEIEARRVRARLDSAASKVDLPALVTRRVGDGAARVLGARLVHPAAPADLIYELAIKDYGIDADDWDAAARFFVDAEVWLRDGDDRRLIWRTRVRTRNPITAAVFAHAEVRDVVTAAALANLSVEEIARALEQLGHYAADKVTDRLRAALDRTRD